MSKPPEKPTNHPSLPPSLSKRLSSLTSGPSQPSEIQKKVTAEQEQQDEQVPLDERWLMSYADKMTLLCGCFIMLFAISTIDPIRLKQLQKATEQSFGRPTSKLENENIEVQQVVNDTKDQEVILRAVLKENEDLKEQVLLNQRESTKNVLQIQNLAQEKLKIEKALNQIQAQLQRAKQMQIKPKETNQSVQLKQLVNKVKNLENQKSQLKIVIEEQHQEAMTSENKIERLNRKISSLEESRNQSTFLAFIMSWASPKQDIDLYVTDPGGRTFDFKKRNYKNHPGLLVLDTRQGPGVEVWQSDRIIPGIYSFKYFFYNSYGNTEPCKVIGTLFTPKGKVSLPPVILSPEKKTQILKLKIDGEGKVTPL